MRNQAESRTVLLITYYFPPLGMGGTQRVAKLCKYLPGFGWRPIVVTVRAGEAYYRTDETLLGDVSSVTVLRTGSLDPLTVAGYFRRRASGDHGLAGVSRLAKLGYLLLPDSKVGWIPFAAKEVLRLLRRRRADVLLVSSPPHSAQFLGLWLWKRTSIPWVADFRDRWYRGEFQPEPTLLHRALDRLGERIVARTADGIVCVTDGLRRHFEQLGARGLVTCIYNGYDPADFAEAQKRKLVRPAGGDRMCIAFVGAITQVAWPGELLEAVRQLEPGERSRIRLLFIGADLTGKWQRAIAAPELEGVVESRDYLPHPEAVKAMATADALFLPVSEKVSMAYVPGKLFEYLASTRPILASVPDGEARAILERAGCVWISSPGDRRALLANLRGLVHLWEIGALPVREERRFVAFSRTEQARAMAAVLEEVAQRARRNR